MHSTCNRPSAGATMGSSRFPAWPYATIRSNSGVTSSPPIRALSAFPSRSRPAPDQIALAPGHLEREWSEGDRHFFRYGIERLPEFLVGGVRPLSVARDQWNGVDLAVYHDPKHGMNVPRMLDAMKQALAYYSTHFGPYPHRQLRIAEFPRTVSGRRCSVVFDYDSLLGGLWLYSRSGRSWVGRLCWHITAHEVGHQWWRHQVAGAAVEGAQFLSESLSEYSALMVAEYRYGAHRMRQYLKYELDTYLLQRAVD